ncbi:MAG: polysulfide reductase NrfD [Myxococcales bacterium]|nr:polysulfide reductase NrfD [Myxococcales bacterium]
MIRYVVYWARMVACVLKGGRLYYTWMGSLLVLILLGAWSYSHDVVDGLIRTNMTDEVSWGIGIANFVFCVGLAASALLLIVPAYVYKRHDAKEVVLFGELLAVVAVVLCLLFIITDIGRPERLWHLFPGIGKLNWPSSMLAWDVVVYTGYLVINLHIPGYLLYKQYMRQKPNPYFYLPFVFISMFWAVTHYTVTGFLLSGLGGRPFWASPILAPRFLVSVGCTAPAVLLIILTVVRRHTHFKVQESVFDYLKKVLRFSAPLNLFLLGCELFSQFYSGARTPAAHYLWVGLNGKHGLNPLIWTALVLNLATTLVWITPRFRKNHRVVIATAALTMLGIWLEKGVGLVIPAFIPTPLGEVVEYWPNFGEILVSVGLAALGAFVFTAIAKVTIAIQTGTLAVHGGESTPRLPAAPGSVPGSGFPPASVRTPESEGAA